MVATIVHSARAMTIHGIYEAIKPLLDFALA